MSLAYTKAQIDQMVADMNQRIATANNTFDVVNTAITTHNTDTEAHAELLSTKANADTVNELQQTIDSLTQQVLDMQNQVVTGFTGSFNYTITGTVGETNVNLQLNIEAGGGREITFELDTERGALAEGLTFNSETKTITGVPTAAANNIAYINVSTELFNAVLRINQTIVAASVSESDDPNASTLARIEQMKEILVSADEEQAESLLGETLVLKMADVIAATGSSSSFRITYDGYLYYANNSYDITVNDTKLCAWCRSDNLEIRIYTDNYGLIKGSDIKNSSGSVIGQLAGTPNFMKDYIIRVNSVNMSSRSIAFEFITTTNVYDVYGGDLFGACDDTNSKLLTYDGSWLEFDINRNLSLRIPTNVLDKIHSTRHYLFDPHYSEQAYPLEKVSNTRYKFHLPSAFDLGILEYGLGGWNMYSDYVDESTNWRLYNTATTQLNNNTLPSQVGQSFDDYRLFETISSVFKPSMDVRSNYYQFIHDQIDDMQGGTTNSLTDFSLKFNIDDINTKRIRYRLDGTPVVYLTRSMAYTRGALSDYYYEYGDSTLKPNASDPYGSWSHRLTPYALTVNIDGSTYSYNPSRSSGEDIRSIGFKNMWVYSRTSTDYIYVAPMFMIYGV